MNISSFFIERPIFATVLAIIITVAGLLAMPVLPISEYPEIVPPTVVVSGQYPGASPKTIAETVITPLEQQINGVENAIYTNSTATPDGTFSITVTFKLGTDLDIAQVQTQNRVAQADTRLPDVVRQIGLVTQKPECLGSVVPSKVYGLMAAGRPYLFIGPLDSTPGEIIEKHNCGWRADCGDVPSLVSLLQRLSEQPGLVARAGERARHAFLHDYNKPQGTARIVAVINAVTPGAQVPAVKVHGGSA